MRFEKCIEEGLIRKDPRATERVKGSLEIAGRFLSASKKNLEIEEYEIAEIAAYNSAFHSARALLFAKGYVERSHYCLSVALSSLYWSEPLRADNELSNINSWRKVHEEDEAALRQRIQDISSS